MLIAFGALRRTAFAAGFCLAAVSSAAIACDDCGRDYYRYYRDYDGGRGNYSCYGGGNDCRYEGSSFRRYYHHYRDRDDGYHYRYYDRYRACDRDCR
jgi:hypothetical protein